MVETVGKFYSSMHNKPKIYLMLSILSVLLLFLAVVKSFYSITLWGESMDVIWLPTLLLIFTLPFLNIVEIIKNPDENNVLHWLALVFNVLSMYLLLRHLGIGLL